MKIKYTLFAATLFAGLSSFASAEDIYVTGSTAFRSSFVGAVVKLMGGTCQAKFEGTAVAGAGRAVFVGSIGGVPNTTVYCSWSGSVTGIQSLTSPVNISSTFLTSDGATLLTQAGNSSAYSYTGGTPNATGPVAHNATLAMSDVFQGSTLHTSPNLAYDKTVAAVPFKFIAGKGAPAAINNMTPLLTQLLYGAGRIKQTLFTGALADSGWVYGLGRDDGSGTRLTVMAESGKGALNQVVQWSYNGTAFANVSNGPSAANGGALATQLGLATTAATGFTIGYLGVTDAGTALTAGAKELSWNGVFYSPEAVYGGQYTMWGYEHLFASNSATAATKTVADAIVAELRARPGSAGLELSKMVVQRGSEGGLVDLND